MTMRIIPGQCAALVVAVALFGCEKEEPITPQEAAQYVEAWAPTVEKSLNDRTEGASVQRQLKEVIQAKAAAEKAKTTKDEPPYDVFVDEVYAEHEYKPRLVMHGKLTPAGEAIWTDVQKVADHALDPANYHLAEISAQIEKLEAVATDINPGELAPTDAEKTWATNWLVTKTKESFALSPENREKLTDELLGSSEGARLKGLMASYTELGEKLAAESAQLEFLLARDWTKLARDLRHQHVRTMFIHPRHDDYYNDPEIRRETPEKRPLEALAAYKGGVTWRKAARVAESMADHTRILHDRIRASLRDVLKSEEPAKVVAAVWPAHPQYKGLIEEHKRYRAIVEAGGWEEVPEKKKLKLGSTDAVVAKLKKRLQLEGYYPEDGKIDKKFDKALEDAIKEYQTTHQMEVDGAPGRTFFRSLNVPAERRLKQIQLNLRRWRKSNVRHDEDDIYVYVNIPAFEAQIWEEGEMKFQTRVVVGNNDWVEDEETEEKTRANRTPVPIAAYIDRAIYNPYWNVTPRVRTNEILPEVKKWMEAQYEAWKNGGTLPAKPATTTGAKPAATTETTFASVGDAPMLPFAEPPPLPERIKVYMNEETGEFDVSTTHPDHIPAWYAANDYEVMYPGKKWEYVRQTQGEHNALGKVKVIFPNYHDVYLHDTNAKALFSRPIRAFSHGCMRMADPLDFAEYLLRRDKVYEEANVPKALKEGTYLPVFLKRQVPVFVEYHSVGIDEKGRANFYADIYDFDEEGIVIPKPATKKASAP